MFFVVEICWLDCLLLRFWYVDRLPLGMYRAGKRARLRGGWFGLFAFTFSLLVTSFTWRVRKKGRVVTPQENPFENYAWRERRQEREREEQGREREEESNRDGRERRLQENYFKDDWYPGDWLLKKLRCLCLM